MLGTKIKIIEYEICSHINTALYVARQIKKRNYKENNHINKKKGIKYIVAGMYTLVAVTFVKNDGEAKGSPTQVGFG